MQVSNLGPCIKVATDFVGIEGMDRILRTNQEFRREGIRSALQPTTMLWHAWRSLANILKLAVVPDKTGTRRVSEAGNMQPRKRQKVKGKDKPSQPGPSSGPQNGRPVPGAGFYYCSDPECINKKKVLDVFSLQQYL